MTEEELKKMNRAKLLGLMLAQGKEIERLTLELKEKKRKLESREVDLPLPGSLMEAQAASAEHYRKTQETADLYLEALRKICGKTS